jgi:hypothetical protein
MTASRRISAAQTAFFKFVLPGAFLVGIGWTVVMFERLLALRDRWDRVGTGGTGGFRMTIALLVMCVAMAIIGIRSGGRLLKRVALTDTALHVSNFWREIAIPLGDVEAVDHAGGGFGRVVITFARDTAFGRRIEFSPIGLFPPTPHPIIAELRAAVAGAKRA